ncbi:methionine ABC transporter permease [Helicobacter sp. 23-1045]
MFDFINLFIHPQTPHSEIFALLFKALGETLYMVGASCAIAVLFGLPLGVILCTTKRGNLTPFPWVNFIIGGAVNVIRSFPFIILIIVLLPLSRLIIGTSIGSSAAIIPLSIAAIPFIARLFEGALDEVDKGLIEATTALGASNLTIIKVMILESLPSLVNAVTITIIGVIGYSAMAGAVGAGGVGDLAMRIGYYSYRADILAYCVVAIIILVQVVQSLGDFAVKYLRRNR